MVVGVVVGVGVCLGEGGGGGEPGFCWVCSVSAQVCWKFLARYGDGTALEERIFI